MLWREHSHYGRRGVDETRELERQREKVRQADAAVWSELIGFDAACGVVGVLPKDLHRFRRMSEVRPSYARELQEARERIALALYRQTGNLLDHINEVITGESDLTILVKATGMLHEQALKAIGQPTEIHATVPPEQALSRLATLLQHAQAPQAALPEPDPEAVYDAVIDGPELRYVNGRWEPVEEPEDRP